MLKLFIAKLSVYANCVSRSQSFYCRIKMSLLFNARNVSFGCCGFHRQCGSSGLSEHSGECQPTRKGSYDSGQWNSRAWGVMAAPAARAAVNSLKPVPWDRVCAVFLPALPVGSGALEEPWEA